MSQGAESNFDPQNTMKRGTLGGKDDLHDRHIVFRKLNIFAC